MVRLEILDELGEFADKAVEVIDRSGDIGVEISIYFCFPVLQHLDIPPNICETRDEGVVSIEFADMDQKDILPDVQD